ncbi:MAG: exonuclease domain-containing protein, partial [Stellaceae bacterium]
MRRRRFSPFSASFLSSARFDACSAESARDRIRRLMREIVLDTETTGLDPKDGHRIVEIACIELQNHLPTGRFFHRYINPQREMTADALLVHGLDDAFLAQHPPFANQVEAFIEFVADAPLVIHNAEFDLAFINAELKRLGRAALA